MAQVPQSEVGTHAFASSYYSHLDPQADISVIAVAQIYIWIIEMHKCINPHKSYINIDSRPRVARI